MNISKFLVTMSAVLYCFSGSLSFAGSLAGPIIIDHNTNDLSQIPDYWIDQVKQKIKGYYGHTSHGAQLTRGLNTIESQYRSKYNVAMDWELPNEPNALCIRDVSTYDWKDFYPTVQEALSKNPEINVVMFGWCGQTGSSDWQTLFNTYTSQMNSLEQSYPNVTFVYMTGNAQENDCAGCNRHRFNEALRRYCKEKNKVLFDFADLDVWYNGKKNTYLSPRWCACMGSVPREHPHWGGGNWDNPCGHSTYGNCEQKGKASWWLFSRLAGWNPSVNPTPPASPKALHISQ